MLIVEKNYSIQKELSLKDDYRLKDLNKNIKGKKIGIPKQYRVDGMPKEIDELWKKGMKIIEDNGGEIIEINLPNTNYALPT